MSTAFQRGLVLFQQNRQDLADREFRQELSQDPDNATAHAFLALCLTELNKHDEALAEAGEAVRLEPDTAFSHYVRGWVLFGRKQFREAEAAVQEAIRLEPFDANALGLLANIAIARHRWSDALEAAERGLAIDAEHATCLNLRALALVQLGRKAEAAATLGSALADDPENALTHANQGWAYLHQGDHARALEHFREALRIDPELEWARVGIVESLKARHLFYRLMLRFLLWMGRQTRVVQFGFLFALIFGQTVLKQVGDAVPAFKPFITPVLGLVFGFLLMTWVASPLFNLLLQLNKFGRLALSTEQKVESLSIGGCFGLAAAAFAANCVVTTDLSFFGMYYFGLLLLPLAVMFRMPAGRPRRLMALAVCAIASMGLPVFSLIFLGPASPLGDAKHSVKYFKYFVDGAILSSWVPALLLLRPR